MQTSERVATRYLVRLALHRTRIAAKIPAAWFKGKSSELKALLKEPLDEGLQHWSAKIEASFTEFFDTFERDFAKVAPTHADAVSPAVREAKRNLRLSLIPWWNLESFRSHHLFNPDGRGVAEQLRHAAGWACVDRVESSVKTVGDLFETTFSVPDGAPERVAAKVLSKAKPADSPRDLVTAVKAAAPRVVVKGKAAWSPARYWYKSMSSGQRARFKALVKAHTVHQPASAPPLLQVMRFTDRDIQSGHRAVDRFTGRFHPLIDKLESSMRTTVEGLQKDLRRFTSLVSDSKVLSGPAIDVHNDYGVPLSKARLRLEEAIAAGDHAAIDQHAIDVVTAAHGWVDAASRAFNSVADAQLEGLEGGREWLDSYVDNSAPVVPVSSYGKTNIDEAFAEVFAHYVLDFDITRDQLESFRTVFER